MKFTIAICTIPSRVKELGKLLDILLPQLTDEVELLWIGDNKNSTIGAKRNRCVNIAQGDYIAFVDDDDTVSDNYVAKILMAIEQEPDVVCFDALHTYNGENPKPVYYDIKHQKDLNLPDEFIRFPNHLMAWSRPLLGVSPYDNVAIGEDQRFAAFMRKNFELTQVKIDEVLYHYDFRQDKSETIKWLKQNKK